MSTRGKPLVRGVPVGDQRRAKTLIGTIVHEADDIFSTGERWEADR